MLFNMFPSPVWVWISIFSVFQSLPAVGSSPTVSWSACRSAPGTSSRRVCAAHVLMVNTLLFLVLSFQTAATRRLNLLSWRVPAVRTHRGRRRVQGSLSKGRTFP